MMNRRRFLVSAPTSLAMLGAAAHPLWGMGTAMSQPLTLQVHPGQHRGFIPRDVMGLSYESTQLGEPEYFAPSNKALVQFLRTLSPSGSLRLGGNTSEFTYFKANATVEAPAWFPQPTQPKELTPITPAALHNLRHFLNVTGWNCIYGLNLGTGTPERAAEEAAAVVEILGSKLEYLQIGNEPNNYIRYRLRSDAWNEKVYLAEWLSFARAIVKRIPTARLAGPDMGAEAAWMNLFASEAVAEMKQHLVAITDHFYAEGPPTSPESTMQNLLLNPKKIDHEINVTATAGHHAGLPFRMTEVNSCYSGGKPGVSNTLGSALWAGDLTLKLLSAGFCGINFHGGSARQIRASLGGKMPGDAVAKSEADDSYYTPIAGSASHGYSARPIFYGMLLVARMAGANLVESSFSEAQSTITAYAALTATGKTMQIAIFNKGSQATDMLLSTGKLFHTASVQRLTGPALEATTGIRFGNATVGSDGQLATDRAEILRRTTASEFKITMPPGSAALVSIHA
ncbi:MAG TPA: glycosyl hydrolase family 79 C-terminal domain-containing protein [Acidobacteriaceae bacterium]